MEGPDEIEEIERSVEVEDFLGSDDSFEGEEGGLTMRKVERGFPRSGGAERVVERAGREELD